METEIATLLNPMWFEGGLHFLGNISCDIDELQLDVDRILCQYLWFFYSLDNFYSVFRSEKNDGCFTRNFERSEENPENTFYFQGEVKDLFQYV